MTRIVGGLARGRRLAVPAGDVRPTSSRTREAVFSSLAHRLHSWTDVVVLDLFAGSGAMGLEAASRGAAAVVLVERDRRVLKVLRRNVADLNLPGITVVAADSYALGHRCDHRDVAAADVVILDPPYRDSNAALCELLGDLQRGHWLASEAIAVVERSARGAAFEWPTGWEVLADRRYADTTVYFARLVASPSSL